MKLLKMTQNVSHTNKMVFDLKQSYQERISQLQEKITEQQREILHLQDQIKFLAHDKFYDC